MERKIRSLQILAVVFVVSLPVFQVYQAITSYKLQYRMLENYASQILSEAMDKELDIRMDGQAKYLVTSQELTPEVVDSLSEEHFGAPAKDAIGFDSNPSLNFHENMRNAINHVMPPRLPVLDSVYRTLLQKEYPNARTSLDIVEMQTGKVIETTADDGKTGGFVTRAVFLDSYSGKALRATIAEPVQVLYRRIIASIMLSVVFVLLALACTAYQLRIVMAQKKINQGILDYLHHITHQLKTPIGVVKNVMDFVESQSVNGSPLLMRQVEMSQRSIGKLINMTGSILRIAAGSKTHIPMDTQRFDLPSELRQAMDELLLERGDTWSDISVVNELEQPDIVADKLHLCDAVANLVDNAIKYSPAGVKVLVRLSEKGQRLRIAVKDNGPGITSVELERIFEKFYRSDRNPVGVEGHGLGLNYVQTVCRAHGGRIKVYSRVGEGSEFVVWLPLIRD